MNTHLIKAGRRSMGEKLTSLEVKTDQSKPIDLGELRKRFHDDEVNYTLLHGDVQLVENKHQWDTDYVLEQYVKDTDSMIGRLDGSIEIDWDDHEHADTAPDTVIWLDKSARPVAWFVDAFWDQFADPGSIKPQDEYVNIDRKFWLRQQARQQSKSESQLASLDFDINAVPKEELARIRALFIVGDLNEETWQSDVWDLPTRLDGQRVLIVDEVMYSGSTLAMSKALLKAAIPEATFGGEYFWRKSATYINNDPSNPDNRRVTSSPVWFNDKDPYGRGVGDVSETYYSHIYHDDPTPENFKKYIGWKVLSAPHFDTTDFSEVSDQKALQLQQDIAYLSYAVAEGKVRRVPDVHRDSDEIVKILDQQGLSTAEYKQYSAARNEQNGT